MHFRFDENSEPQELLTFLGASYFRAVARNTRFGISARGLALETGMGKPEEFPVFTNFWIFRPGDPHDPLQICALLDSPSVAGAYRFDVAPRDGTMVAVDASLFFRGDIAQVGIAPLTSMYFFGSQRPGGRRRLPGRGPRFGRAVDLARHRGGCCGAPWSTRASCG